MSQPGLMPQTDDDKDYEEYVPKTHKKPDRRSALVKAREAFPNEIINACPFGCVDKDLDTKTFCKHLVGFTDPEDKDVFYPQRYRPNPKSGKVEFDRRGEPLGQVFTDGSDPQMVEPADRLVRITNSYRVYRKEPLALPQTEETPDA